jgi:phosphoglycerate dehydrogenase-like enzyme
MTRILLTEAAFTRIKAGLDALAERLEIATMNKAGEIRLAGRAISEAEAAPDCTWLSADILFAPNEPQFRRVLLQAPKLQWAQSAGAGVDLPIFGMLLANGVRLTTNHEQAVGISEYILAGVLNHFQGAAARRAEQAAHRWTASRAREVMGSRWLIVGYGAIGEAVAQRAKGFGAHVTGVRRNRPDSFVADAMATPAELPQLLPESDVVVLTMPKTPETENTVDARFFAAMKPGAVLVNVGRGAVVDDDALRAALDAGKPEHAILDVFRQEPLPADSWFWDHPRVTLTPHNSAASSGVVARGDALFLDNLNRFLAGKPMRNELKR